MGRHLETGYRMMPEAAAKLFDYLTTGRANHEQVCQIAEELLARCPPEGRLLDVGPGPGRLLLELADRAPGLRLTGLELSPSMLELARHNLEGRPVELHQGSIEATPFAEGAFDLVTCTGSLYAWTDPARGLDEIHRVLKPGGQALLFETHRGFSRLAYLRGLGEIFQAQGLARGLLSPIFLTQQLRMTYHQRDYEAMLRRSPFAESFVVEPITLARLPIWVRISGRKK